MSWMFRGSRTTGNNLEYWLIVIISRVAYDRKYIRGSRRTGNKFVQLSFLLCYWVSQIAYDREQLGVFVNRYYFAGRVGPEIFCTVMS